MIYSLQRDFPEWIDNVSRRGCGAFCSEPISLMRDDHPVLRSLDYTRRDGLPSARCQVQQNIVSKAPLSCADKVGSVRRGIVSLARKRTLAVGLNAPVPSFQSIARGLAFVTIWYVSGFSEQNRKYLARTHPSFMSFCPP